MSPGPLSNSAAARTLGAIPMQRVLAISIAFLVLSLAARLPAQDQNADEPTVEELLQKLERLRNHLSGVPPQRGEASESLALMLEDSNLLNTNNYGPEGVRYFSTRLVVINLSEEPVTIDPETIELIADGDRKPLLTDKERIQGMVFRLGDQTRRYSDVRPTEPVEIAPGATASVWLLFVDLEPGADVPPLELRIPLADELMTLDVNAYHRGLLGLGVERIGPKNCLAKLTIAGELNSINAGSLIAELDRLAEADVSRVVISWTDSAAAVAESLTTWLTSAHVPNQQRRYIPFPSLPVTITELHLAGVVDAANSQPLAAGNHDGVVVHESLDAAAIAALETAYAVLPRAAVRREIVLGHRLSRAAALTHGASRLTIDDLPMILSAVDDPDPVIRKSALIAARYFGQPEAITALMHAVRGDNPELAEVALASLAGSRYPAAHAALLSYLGELPPERQLPAVEILAQFPRPIWSDLLYQYFHSGDHQLQLAALRALSRIGHPRLFEVLADGMESEHEDLRQEAFIRLSQRTDAPSDKLATEYALQLLEEKPPTGHVESLLTRTREPRAVPLLLKHLDSADTNHSALIRLLVVVGGADVIDELTDRYPDFEDQQKQEVLRELIKVRSPAARPLALQAFKANETALLPAAAQVLSVEADSEAVALIAKTLHESEDASIWNSMANVLGSIGTSEAREELLIARGSDEEGKRTAAAHALQRIKQSSPAWHYTDREAVQAIRDREFEKAIELLDLAIQFDPQLAEAYSHRGHVRLLQEQPAEARPDFARAAELDPYEPLGVTGLAIVTALEGKHEEAVRQITEAAERFPDDPTFEYNTACVYGRAIEQVAAEEESQQRDETLSEYQAAAMQHLSRSVELGFADFEHIRNDPDLETLRELPEFEELLSKAPEPDESSEEEEEEKLRARPAPAGVRQKIQIQF
ncbi:MAG: hypothetical protein DWQ34_25080 [Planctomycetota bacterium]|nr:MAG: hypothetical protein DWQ34_25080 [Planctomycetota bacterium]REK27348.1 MAG: hypothetical protein DWQ41_08275 [Planctomycetota bacterium]REK36630.1 MAG: hypothetical protein DWQ45_08355 [Planctomycetota bacterium]